jgi:hypothetical protein
MNNINVSFEHGKYYVTVSDNNGVTSYKFLVSKDELEKFNGKLLEYIS